MVPARLGPRRGRRRERVCGPGLPRLDPPRRVGEVPCRGCPAPINLSPHKQSRPISKESTSRKSCSSCAPSTSVRSICTRAPRFGTLHSAATNAEWATPLVQAAGRTAESGAASPRHRLGEACLQGLKALKRRIECFFSSLPYPTSPPPQHPSTLPSFCTLAQLARPYAKPNWLKRWRGGVSRRSTSSQRSGASVPARGRARPGGWSTPLVLTS